MKEQFQPAKTIVNQIPQTFNGVDGLHLNPTNFLGFPTRIVADASVAPTVPIKAGQIIFQIDNKSGTPHWYLWTYLFNVSTKKYGFHFIQLT